MNGTTAKPYRQPELSDPARPRTIETWNSAAFFAVCEREKRRELKIESLDSLAAAGGKGNGAWCFNVRWLC